MKIKSADFVISVAKPDAILKNTSNEFAVIGKSNVGKSTFINSVLNNKKIAKYQSGLKEKQYTSNKIDYIRMKRDCKINDYLQKTAKDLVNYLVSQTITTLIVGKNKGWKNN